ncbi:hypothetical protein AVEN_46380-1 [Araneus ventricosus]|uniref:Uncharacterized protein n=1 Tax=Araneus ventricosus TaxID=182803 RepID=A0A4Y2JN71_ARAVE|nr:hypothetical protein AVEN_46380-1 [Araneus ventricosus]
MARSSARVFKKRKGSFNKGKCQEANESQNTFSENSSECAKLSTGKLNLSSSEKKLVNMNVSYSRDNSSGFRNGIVGINILACVFFEAVKCLNCEKSGF